MFRAFDRWLSKLYDNVIELSTRPNAMFWLCFISFIESFFFPIPPYVIMVPMILARKSIAFRAASLAMLSSVLGGLVGYYIGKYSFDLVAIPMFEFYGFLNIFKEFEEYYHRFGLFIIMLGSLTPFPYKLVAIMSGAVSLNIWMFTFGSLIARSLRFYIVAWILYKFGISINEFIKKHLFAVTMVFIVFTILSLLFMVYF